jgi:photosystem II stability/assembly factor-like uncharacterized protein
MKPYQLIPALLLCFCIQLHAQLPRVDILTSGTKTSLRGLSVVNDNVVWVSGSNGTVGRSNNGGKNWNWFTVKGFEKTEFRDIEAFDASTAIIMGIADPAYILKTTDGGETWKVVYENKTKGMFLDAMDFVGEKYGIVVGDPIANKIFLAETWDGGESWKERIMDNRFPAADNKNFFLVSGGKRSRLLTPAASYTLPFVEDKESAGANSVAVYTRPNLKSSNRLIVVGGDFAADTSVYKNCFITANGGKTWKVPDEPPHGYRSCVEYLSERDVLACGLNGVDYSATGGNTWQWISKESFNTCRIAKKGTTIYLAGNNGKVGKLLWR